MKHAISILEGQRDWCLDQIKQDKLELDRRLAYIDDTRARITKHEAAIVEIDAAIRQLSASE